MILRSCNIIIVIIIIMFICIYCNLCTIVYNYNNYYICILSLQLCVGLYQVAGGLLYIILILLLK